MAEPGTRPLSVDEILLFWENPENYESIINAKPLECLISQESSEQIAKELYESLMGPIEPDIGETSEPAKRPRPSQLKNPEGNFEMVKDDELTHFPQRSVGKLFWLKSGKLKPSTYWSSAFFVQEDKVLTVCHAFYDIPDDVTIDSAVFVPAMINKYDIFGQHFGFYALGQPLKTPPRYRDVGEWTPQDDIAAIPLARRRKMTNFIDYPNNAIGLKELQKLFRKHRVQYENLFEDVEIHDFSIQPIQLFTPYSPSANWTIYGYGEKDDGGVSEDGSDGGKMSKVSGSYIPDRKMARWLHANHAFLFVGMDVVARRGMSGGPWIRELTSVSSENSISAANGIQSLCTRRFSILENFQNWIKRMKILEDYLMMSLSPRFSYDLPQRIDVKSSNYDLTDDVESSGSDTDEHAQEVADELNQHGALVPIPVYDDGHIASAYNDLVERYRITNSQLDEEIDVLLLASRLYIAHRKMFLHHLGLFWAEIKDMIHGQMMERHSEFIARALRRWQRINSRAATYRNLLKILIDLEEEESVHLVCSFLGHSS